MDEVKAKAKAQAIGFRREAMGKRKKQKKRLWAIAYCLLPGLCSGSG